MLNKIIKSSIIGFSIMPMVLGATDYQFNALENVGQYQRLWNRLIF